MSTQMKIRLAVTSATIALLLAGGGCGSGKSATFNRGFFTSGSRDADQRADQRMAKAEQLEGNGEGTGDKAAKKTNPENVVKATDKKGADGPSAKGTQGAAAQVEGKSTLYDRLNGEKGIRAIVEDFTPRVMQDPRVNWNRNGVKWGGFNWSHDKSVTWNPTPANVEQLNKHIIQFLTLSTGGPAHYDGKDMASAHTHMHITNPEFDAAIGDLKASLDHLQIANKEQKELLSIIESVRPQIVEER